MGNGCESCKGSVDVQGLPLFLKRFSPEMCWWCFLSLGIFLCDYIPRQFFKLLDRKDQLVNTLLILFAECKWEIKMCNTDSKGIGMKIHNMVKDITTAYAQQNTISPQELLAMVQGLYIVILNFDKTGKSNSNVLGKMVGDSLAGMSSAKPIGSIGESIKDAAVKAQKYGIGHGISVPGFDKPVSKQRPAVPINQSVTDDCITCLECGEEFKMIKKHLKSSHGQTPIDYLLKWELPQSHPMVAPGYSATQRKMAIDRGFGKGNRKS